ncbi:MAG: D-2-hydroxyacid dehydrogenase [Bryobacterales bacterium]|nr:D-2-hydroxyacid dehydrogenase [Bryobacterales bacterium]
MSATTLWVLSKPGEKYLRLLDQLPATVKVIIGEEEALFLSAPAPDVVFCGIGKGKLLRSLWPQVKDAKWLHSFTAGLESVLFPELVESSLPMSNAKGLYGRSLGEFAIAAALFFAKDFRRMLRSQAAHEWDQFDVEELTGATFGIIGYGGIGREAARRALALGMKVVAIKRHPDPVDGIEVLPPSGLHDMLPRCDYLMVSAPNTPETKGMLGAEQIAMLKPNCVLINVGRGSVVDEDALIAALEQKRIKGAALDVFNVEPLPAGHAFYKLENVLLSPHCADHTATWLDDSMQFFIENLGRFQRGDKLENLVDKKLGY